MIGIGIFIGAILALMKISIEYRWWQIEKDEVLFHSVGFGIVALLLLSVLIISKDYFIILYAIISYWNVFELVGNISHNQHPLYVGQSAFTDRLIRKIAKNYKITKLIIHILTICLIFLIKSYNS